MGVLPGRKKYPSPSKSVLPVVDCELAASFNINKQLDTMKILKVEQILIFDIWCAVMAKVYLEKVIPKLKCNYPSYSRVLRRRKQMDPRAGFRREEMMRDEESLNKKREKMRNKKREKMRNKRQNRGEKRRNGDMSRWRCIRSSWRRLHPGKNGWCLCRGSLRWYCRSCWSVEYEIIHSLDVAPDQTVSINSTAPLIYPMQLHPHYQLSNAGRQKLKM